jgi:hypothetical protein
MQISTKLITLLAAICILLPVTQVADAKKKSKLIQQKPVYDRSGEHPYFELKIKYSRIVYPQDINTLLRAKARAAYLKSGVKANILHGHVKDSQVASTINTIQYNVRSHFHADLQGILAETAPDIALKMDAQIGAARHRLADDLLRMEPLMKQELAAARPQPVFLPLPPALKVATTRTNMLQSLLEKSKENMMAASASAKVQLDAALKNAQRFNTEIYKIPMPGAGVKIEFPKFENGYAQNKSQSASHVNVSISQKQMEAELARANQQRPSSQDISTQLTLAKPQTHAAIAAAQPELETILTYVKSPQPNKATTQQSVDAHLTYTETVLWDDWHKQFAKLASAPILNAVSKLKDPSGSNTVEITVWDNHRLSAMLVKANNPEFDKAVLNAYRSLTGNPSLQFPTGSKRDSITFLISNKNTGAGTPVSIKSQTALGDKEIIRVRR